MATKTLDKKIAELAARFGGTQGSVTPGRAGSTVNIAGFTFTNPGTTVGPNALNFVQELNKLRAADNPNFGKSPAVLAEEKANALNEQRFQQGLDIFGEREKLIGGLGEGQRQDIANQTNQLRARGIQDLISRGLNYSSGALDVERSAADFSRQSTLELEDRLSQLRSNLLGEKTGFIERVTDVGPDLSLLTSLQRAASGAPSRQASRDTTTDTGSAGNPFSILKQPSSSGGSSRPRLSQRERQMQSAQEKLAIQQANRQSLSGSSGKTEGQKRLDFERQLAQKSARAERNKQDEIKQINRELARLHSSRKRGNAGAIEKLVARLNELRG